MAEATPEKTPEELAAREERKKQRAAKEAAIEKALTESKEQRPQIWASLDSLIGTLTALPQEEQNVNAQLVQRVFKNRLRPGRKAVSREKLLERLERARKQEAKILEQLGEDPTATTPAPASGPVSN